MHPTAEAMAFYDEVKNIFHGIKHLESVAENLRHSSTRPFIYRSHTRPGHLGGTAHHQRLCRFFIRMFRSACSLTASTS